MFSKYARFWPMKRGELSSEVSVLRYSRSDHLSVYTWCLCSTKLRVLNVLCLVGWSAQSPRGIPSSLFVRVQFRPPKRRRVLEGPAFVGDQTALVSSSGRAPCRIRLEVRRVRKHGRSVAISTTAVQSRNAKPNDGWKPYARGKLLRS